MKSRWSDNDAEGMVRRYAQQGIGRDLALRVYTSRLLGRDPLLVLHGGGNTSVKTKATDLEMVRRYAQQGIGRDLALRVYTSRLLGRDPLLVLHGGGNTSVKTKATDL